MKNRRFHNIPLLALATAVLTVLALSGGIGDYRTWMENTPSPVNQGGSLVWTGGHNIYALRGGGVEKADSTEPPTKPQLYLPENGQKLTENTPTFEWTHCERADSYRLLIDNDPGFTSPEENRVMRETRVFYTTTSDGYIENSSRDAATGEVTDDTAESHVGQTLSWVRRGFVFFDTSSLPDTAVITAATLTLNAGTPWGGLDNNFDIVVQNGQPTYPHDPLEAGDFYYGHYSDNGGAINTSGFGVFEMKARDITLNENGRSWIKKDNTTKFCLRSSRDIDDNEPTGVEYIIFSTRVGGVGQTYWPKLTVTYIDNTYTIADEDSLPNDNYYWKVVATNEYGENESDVWTFKMAVGRVTSAIVAEADAEVTEGNPDSPDSPDYIYNLYNGWNPSFKSERDYFRFNLENIPPSAEIENAVLRANSKYGPSGPGGFDDPTSHLVDAVPVDNDDWDESTLTWNNAPPPGTTVFDTKNFQADDFLIGDPRCEDPDQGRLCWYSWDVTSYVASEFAGGDPLVSICLKAQNESVYDSAGWFYSKDDSKHPYLEVTWSGVVVSISPSENIGLCGENVTFTVTIMNGTSFDAFKLESSNTEGWPLEIENEITIPAGQNRATTLTVTIPPTAEEGDFTTATVTVTALENENVSNNASCLAKYFHDRPIYTYLTWGSNDTAHTIVVTWKTVNADTGDNVLYDIESREGNPEPYENSATGSPHTYPGAGGYIHDVELTGLSPDSIYYFICGGDEEGYSAERSFRTPPEVPTSIRFVAGGDSRHGSETNWPEERDDISREMAKFNPSFVLFTGDFVMTGSDQDEWNNWFAAAQEYWVDNDGLTIPMITCIGNHEVYYPQPSDYDPENEATNYYEQFCLPGNERWYSLDFGPDLHITVLDSEILSRSDAWNEQLSWLESDLAEHESCTWKIAIFHRPAYSAGYHGQKTSGNDAVSRELIREDWVPLFDEYHVDLVVNAHDHDYERTYPLYDGTVQPYGTTYVVSGGWGAPLRDVSSQLWTAYSAKKYNFTVVDISEDTLHMRAVDRYGETFDENYIMDYGVDVSISPAENIGWPGENVTFSVEVANVGKFDDNYELAAVPENAEWVANLAGNLVSPAAGTSENVILTVTIPPTAEEGDNTVVTVSATSQENENVKDNASCLAHAVQWGVDVLILESWQENLPGGTLVYTVTITNTGNVSDNYALENTDNATWGLSLSENLVEVANGTSANVTLTVTIPEDATGCESDNITITAISQGNAEVKDNDSCIAHVKVVRRVEVLISPGFKHDLPEENVTFTVTVKNEGNVSDNYGLSVEDTKGWAPTLDNDSLVISENENETTTLRVHIPENAELGMSDTIIVTATSRTDNTVTDNDNCAAYALPSTGVSVSISPDENIGWLGENVTFTVTVTNEGNVTDNYDLAVTDDAVWGATLDDYLLESVAPDENRQTTLSVTVPGDASEGDSTSITVTATSQENENVSDSDTCTVPAVENIVRGVSISISPDYQENVPGGTIEYEVTITNTGELADDYDLTVTDDADWGAAPDYNLFENVAPGENRQTTVRVTVPSNVIEGDTAMIIVTARSQVDPTVENSGTCTAEAAAVPVEPPGPPIVPLAAGGAAIGIAIAVLLKKGVISLPSIHSRFLCLPFADSITYLYIIITKIVDGYEYLGVNE